jgi:LysM repeat protein
MKFFIINGLLLMSSFIFGQKMTREQYVSKYFQLAVQEMNQYKIPASITLAQGILETESGNSDLCKKAKNHFGIKCQMTWTGMKFIKDDDTKNECFRAYTDDIESFRDHSTFLLRSRYEKLFSYEMTDYRSWAYGLKEAGYATNPNYPLMLIKHIEDLKLYQFDNYGNESSINGLNVSQTATTLVSAEEEQTRLKLRKERANGLEFIVVDSSFNIYDLSSQKNIPLKNLMLFNEIENEQTISIGQNFFLQAKKSKNNQGIHEVKTGQSIYDIAQIYGVKTIDLRMYNKLDLWEQPFAGEQLFLNSTRDNYIKTRPYADVLNEKNKSQKILIIAQEKLSIPSIPTKFTIEGSGESSSLKTTSTSDQKQWINYKVKTKETLFKISKNFGCGANDILVWNNLKLEDGLSVGQVVKVLTSFPNGINAPVNSTKNEQAIPVKSNVEVRYENGIKIERKVSMTELYKSLTVKDSVK